MSIKRHLSPDRPHLFCPQDAIKYGVEKSIILANIEDASSMYFKENLYEYFPYFEKHFFYNELNELIKSGLLIEE